MGKGYQIVEPVDVDPVSCWPRHQVFAVPTLAWLCELLRAELPDQVPHVDFEVIRVMYLGSYPSIGLHYKTAGHPDIGPLVEETAARLLREKPVLDFVRFLGASDTDWKEVTARLMAGADDPLNPAESQAGGGGE